MGFRGVSRAGHACEAVGNKDHDGCGLHRYSSNSFFTRTDVSCGPRLRSHIAPTSHTHRSRPVNTTSNPALSMDATTRAQMKNAAVKICSEPGNKNNFESRAKQKETKHGSGSAHVSKASRRNVNNSKAYTVPPLRHSIYLTFLRGLDLEACLGSAVLG